MFGLFVRMYGFAVAAVLVVYLAMNWFESMVVGQVATGNLRERFGPIFTLTETLLQDAPPAAWPARFEQLKPRFSYPTRMQSVDTVAQEWTLPPVTRKLLVDGRILVFELQNYEMVAMRRLGASDHVLVLYLPGLSSMRYVGKVFYIGLEVSMVAILIFLWVRPFWRDLTLVHQAAGRVGEGHFDTRIALKKTSPLFPLAGAFNSMTQRISDLLAAHRELTTAVSHELRNPLMRLRFRHDLARDGAAVADKDRNLDEMAQELDELDRLVDEMLTYAKVKNVDPELHLEAIAVAPWLAEMERAARDLALAQGREVALTFEACPGPVKLEPRHMARAVSNLLSNAIRYARHQVVVRLEQRDGRTEIHVDDDGPGVDPAQRDNVFEPFWRGDASRDRKTGGFGIGLAVVRRVARWHGGEVEVTASPLGGARFTITW